MESKDDWGRHTRNNVLFINLGTMSNQAREEDMVIFIRQSVAR